LKGKNPVGLQIKTFSLLKYFIALIWLINGLFCKLLNFVPRHEEIVKRILGVFFFFTGRVLGRRHFEFFFKEFGKSATQERRGDVSRWNST